MSLRIRQYLFKANHGVGTNNLGELKSYFYILKSAHQKNLHSLHVYEDSTLVINNLLGKIHISRLSLHVVGNQLL